MIEKVNQSEAPIVAVPKSNGRIQICRDYKVTVNPHIEPDRHPHPKTDDVFASLSGDKKFTKIDFSHAYLQMMLDEESKKFMVINTHKGLYQYTRMPFGTRATDQEHVHNLEEVLK